MLSAECRSGNAAIDAILILRFFSFQNIANIMDDVSDKDKPLMITLSKAV